MLMYLYVQPGACAPDFAALDPLATTFIAMNNSIDFPVTIGQAAKVSDVSSK